MPLLRRMSAISDSSITDSERERERERETDTDSPSSITCNELNSPRSLCSFPNVVEVSAAGIFRTKQRIPLENHTTTQKAMPL